LGLWGLLIFLFVGLHKCGPFNLVNFHAPLLCGLGPKLQGLMILTPLFMWLKCQLLIHYTAKKNVSKKFVWAQAHKLYHIDLSLYSII